MHILSTGNVLAGVSSCRSPETEAMLWKRARFSGFGGSPQRGHVCYLVEEPIASFIPGAQPTDIGIQHLEHGLDGTGRDWTLSLLQSFSPKCSNVIIIE